MSESRPFHLGAILSVTTERLFAPGGIAAVHELLDFMTGDILFTHQLPRVVSECAPELLRQHPDLANVPVPAEFAEPCKETVPAWLAEQVARFGEYREVSPLAPANHTHINPIAEMAMRYPTVPVVPIVMEARD